MDSVRYGYLSILQEYALCVYNILYIRIHVRMFLGFFRCNISYLSCSASARARCTSHHNGVIYVFGLDHNNTRQN